VAVLGQITSPRIVGRDAEQQALAADAAAARHGPHITLLTGPAGAGKTRLVEHARELATADATVVLAGSCTPEAVHRYGPLTAALMRHLRGLDDDEAEALFSGGARLARGLVRGRFVDAPDLSAVDPDLVDAALVDLLARLAVPSVALVVEDLHWAGGDTAAALTYIVTEADLPLWLVLTMRDDEADDATIGGLLHAVGRTRHTRIALEPLGVDDVAALVEAAVGDAPPEGFAEALHARSGGWPLLVEELCRSLIEDGRLDAAAGRWPAAVGDVRLPISIGAAVERRLAALAPEHLHVLRVAALAGDELDVDLVASASNVEPAAVRTAVEAGLGAQLLSERRAGGVGGIGFRHALLRQAVADGVPAADRPGLHLDIAQALRATLSEDEASAAVVEHLAAGGEPDAAAEHALAAAARARQSGAPATARSLHERAVGLASPGTQLHARACLALADFLDRTDPKRTLALAGEAHRWALANGDALLTARSLLRASAVRMHLHGTAGRAAVLEAVEWVRGRGEADEHELLCDAAELLVADGSSADLALARELVDRAAGIAAGDTDASARTARLARLRCIAAASVPEGLAAGEEAVAAARSVGPAELAASLWALGTWLLWDVGEFARAEELFLRCQDLAEQFTARRPGLVLPVLAELAAYRGQYADAIAQANLPVWREAMAEHDACWVLVEAHRRLGNDAAALTAAERAAQLLAERASVTAQLGAAAAMGHGALARHGPGAALEHFDEALRLAPQRARLYHDVFSPDHARALFALGELDRLREVAAATARLSDGLPPGTRGRAASDLCASLHALATDRHDDAAVLARRAAAAWAAMPYPARTAEAHLAEAEAHRRAGRRDDSLATARRAAEIAAQIGSPPLAADAQGALDRLGRPGRRAGAAPAGAESLTPRERDVVRLSCEGLTAQQVATRLGLSRRTIESHLGHAKDKLGVASKAELVRRAVELGLT
jgi:DNA-binding CsgD family transcriptional regulator